MPNSYTMWPTQYRAEVRRILHGVPPSLRHQIRRTKSDVIKSRLFFLSIAHLPILEREQAFRRAVNPYSDFERLKSAICICIPKVAGNSVCEAVFQSQGLGHDKANRYHAKSQAEFEKSFKFCFVRNPWDRLVSTFHYLKHGGIGWHDKAYASQYLRDYDNFTDFMLAMDDEDKARQILRWTHFEPQYSYTAVRGEKVGMDFVGRLENLEADLKVVFDRLGMKPKDVPHKNKSPRGDYRHYYNKKSQDIARKLYREDIDLFDYSF